MIDLPQTRSRIRKWLDRMAEGLPEGHFRYCAQGAIISPSAQMPTVFATKAAWQAGIWEAWPAERRQGCIDHLKSFQVPEGWFIDPWLKRAVMSGLRTSLLDLLKGRQRRVARPRALQEQNIRAETRQSLSTLNMVDAAPPYAPPLEIDTPEGARHFVDMQDWSNPWSAGAQVSHLIFFASVAEQSETGQEILNTVCDALDERFDAKTGTWGDPRSSDILKINGAMKILSGWQWCDRALPDLSALIDLALSQPFEDDGCGFTNRMFVLREARQYAPADYRRDEIAALARQSLTAVERFRASDGAFSFNPGRSQTNYYGAKVSQGKSVSDLHGTVMMGWAIALACDLLQKDAPMGAEYWSCHRA